jgi:general secretion pathway protein B
MSFILDALRKSENERRRSALPGVAQIPLAARHPRLPPWALAVIGLLAAAVVALSAAWWRSSAVGGRPSTTSALRPEATSKPLDIPPPGSVHHAPPVPAPNLPAARESAPAETAAAAPPPVPSRSGPSEARVAAVPDAVAAAASKTPPAAARESAPAPPATTDTGPTLPSAEALAAEGISVPPLRLQLHAYDKEPDKRYVFINGSKYAEGDRLAEGPRVVTIEPDGVVLSQQGRRFLLMPE